MDNNTWTTTNAGVKIPRLIYGTAWKKEKTADYVEEAIKTGFRGIDTAGQPKHYNEPLVGEALEKLIVAGIKREDIYLQTKFTPISGQDPSNMPYHPGAPIDHQVRQSFESSLENLKTDYLDSLVLHSPVHPGEDMVKVWSAMEEIYQKGKAKQLGISNCYHLDFLKALWDAVNVKPAVVQNRFYQQTGYDKELRQWCKEKGVIYQSFWTLTANPHILSGKTVRELCKKYQKSAPQILFRSLIQEGMIPLTGTTSTIHMKQDLEIFEFELEESEVDEVHRLFE